MTTALVVSPDTSLCSRLRGPVSSLTGWEVDAAELAHDAVSCVRRQNVGAVFLDCRQDEFEQELRDLLNFLEREPSTLRPRVIGIADQGYPRSIWPLLDRVVWGHLSLPLDPQSLSEQLLGSTAPCEDGGNGGMEARTLAANGLSFTTRTPAMFPFLAQLELVAARDVTLLFTGETGTGKSYLAQLVHELSPRRSGPFFATACGALPPDLIESELFGHVRGAFTSAVRASEGRFEAARGGTLLLDEIDVLGPKEQSKLLHVIETGKYEPVGSTETRIADVRLIVASNVDLRALAERHLFRADLYYRLNVLEFHLCPLRERPHDIIPLATRFIDETCERHKIPVTRMDLRFLDLLKRYHWPGNIRELLNQMRRAVLLSRNGLLTSDSLSLDLQSDRPGRSGGQGDRTQAAGWNLNRRLARSEREFLLETLRAHDDNRAATARALGISRAALYKKMHRFGMLDASPAVESNSRPSRERQQIGTPSRLGRDGVPSDDSHMPRAS